MTIYLSQLIILCIMLTCWQTPLEFHTGLMPRAKKLKLSNFIILMLPHPGESLPDKWQAGVRVGARSIPTGQKTQPNGYTNQQL